jgi:glucose-6-phosphate 1-dehydrogenase
MKSRCCPCVCVFLCILPNVARQRLGKNPRIVARQPLGRNVTALTNTQAAIEELFDASFSMCPVSYQGK